MHVMMQYKGSYDYYDTYRKLATSRFAVVEPTQKGLLQVWFKGFRHAVLISPKGKVLVHCDNEQEKKRLHYILERYLGKLEPLKISLTSHFMQLISLFPLQTKLRFSACDTTYTYNLSWWNPRARPPLRKLLLEHLPFVLPFLFMSIFTAAVLVIVAFPGSWPLVVWCLFTALSIAVKKKVGFLYSALFAAYLWLFTFVRN